MTKGNLDVLQAQKQKLPKVCLVDTNFLISLAKPDDANHVNAHEYLELLKSVGAVFMLSAIVEAEYEHGSITNVIALLGPERVRRIPFDHTEAQQARTLKARHERERKANKQAHLADMMIVGQALKRNVDAVITGDKKMLSFLSDVGVKGLNINTTVNDFMLSETPLYGSDLQA